MRKVGVLYHLCFAELTNIQPVSLTFRIVKLISGEYPYFIPPSICYDSLFLH